jgi:hypothetical protein
MTTNQINPDGVCVLEARLGRLSSAWVATYVNLGSTSVLNDLIAKANGAKDHYLKSFVTSAKNNFGRIYATAPSSSSGWSKSTRTELVQYTHKDHGLSEDDMNHG